MNFGASYFCIIRIYVHTSTPFDFVKLIHANFSRRIITKHIQWMKAEVKTVTASFYITFLFVVLSFFILEVSTFHIGVESFITFYFCKPHRDSNIIRKVRPEYHVRHVVGIKSGYSRTDGGKE